MVTTSSPSLSSADDAPLALVRYGIAREIQLFPDALVFVEREDAEASRFDLATIRTLIVQPGERVPSKLLILLELNDGATVIAAEGMTNVRAFLRFLPALQAAAPHLRLDPPDMAAQLDQAVANRRQANLGCYGAVAAAALLIVLIFLIGSLIIHLR